jgi:hypothetical protein
MRSTEIFLDRYEDLIDELHAQMAVDPALREEADLQETLVSHFLSERNVDASVDVLCGVTICLLEFFAESNAGLPKFSDDDLADLRIPPGGLMTYSRIDDDGMAVMQMALVRASAPAQRGAGGN